AARDRPEENYVKAKVTGKVTTGVLAPGGQTTGKTITAAGVTWELDAAGDKDKAAAIDRLNGKTAEVAGTVEVKKLTTRPGQRVLVKVASIRAAGK
ncbi:MAG TPA: hypothetical protein VFA26_06170, partial [Gemmataceae bacterium]|nr:hypothetical protein [Gemmataceae bacterium]